MPISGSLSQQFVKYIFCISSELYVQLPPFFNPVTLALYRENGEGLKKILKVHMTISPKRR